jgi:ABC-2 type transport system ATP-binding protein
MTRRDARPTREPAVETHDLEKRYGEVEALSGLTMRVERGEVFGFLGPNGAGKTTAVKLLLGLSRPTAGAGRVLGAPMGDRAARRRVGYLPELFRYQSWMRAREVLAFHCALAGVPRDTWATEIGEALRIVGLADRSDDLVGTFSKGMQQRLGIGVALLGKPDLVLLDEPTSALDPVGRQDVRRIIREVRDRGAAVFLNSHLLGEVERVCDRVAIVDHGRVVGSGAIDDILAVRTVRIRVTGLGPTEMAKIEAYGPFRQDGPWLTTSGLDPERVPDLVAAIVAAGGRIHAVEQARESLEDRFFGLVTLGQAREAATAAATRPPDPPNERGNGSPS